MWLYLSFLWSIFARIGHNRWRLIGVAAHTWKFITNTLISGTVAIHYIFENRNYDELKWWRLNQIQIWPLWYNRILKHCPSRCICHHLKITRSLVDMIYQKLSHQLLVCLFSLYFQLLIWIRVVKRWSAVAPRQKYRSIIFSKYEFLVINENGGWQYITP